MIVQEADIRSIPFARRSWWIAQSELLQLKDDAEGQLKALEEKLGGEWRAKMAAMENQLAEAKERQRERVEDLGMWSGL